MEVRDHKLRKVISRFRLSSHSLEIEKGRHCRPKIPASERKCNVCKNNEVEDENHFLMSCSGFDNLRQEYFNMRNNNSLENNFISIVNCEVTCFNLAKLLQKMFKLRKEILS